jgi:formamidopyrimidine-DNA glycosylase
MPEGDVVWLTARRLREALKGRVLTRSDFRVPRFATADLRGRTVLDAVSRGKHLLVRVEGGSSLGLVELLRTDDEDAAVGHLGPDLLDPAWGPRLEAEAVARLAEDPARAIGEALLDQTRVAGIGNVYKAEVLFLRGVNPWTAIGNVPDISGLVQLSHRLLDANKERHGHITTGELGRGREHWVYGRAGRPCRRCGARIERADQGPPGAARAAFWCPRCQPVGARPAP